MKIQLRSTMLAASLAAAAPLFACGADFEAGSHAAAEALAPGEPLETVDGEASTSEIGALEQSLTSCSNVDGTNSVMAATAVAVAKELRRWQPKQDLYIASASFGQYLALTSTGKSRCSGGVCWMTQALLDMQKPSAAGKVKLPGGITVNPDALRSRFVAKYGEQLACESQPDNHDSSNCPAEQHQLAYLSSAPGACDTISTFRATTPTGGALAYPAQLKNKLLWVDRHNPYVAFTSTGDRVSIDPVYGLTEGGGSSTGSCSAACTKVTNNNISGQCCSCNGATRNYVRSLWNSATYLCQ